MAKKKNTGAPKKTSAKAEHSVGKYANHPFFIKQAEEAKAFLKKVGLPKGWPPVKF